VDGAKYLIPLLAGAAGVALFLALDRDERPSSFAGAESVPAALPDASTIAHRYRVLAAFPAALQTSSTGAPADGGNEEALRQLKEDLAAFAESRELTSEYVAVALGLKDLEDLPRPDEDGPVPWYEGRTDRWKDRENALTRWKDELSRLKRRLDALLQQSARTSSRSSCKAFDNLLDEGLLRIDYQTKQLAQLRQEIDDLKTTEKELENGIAKGRAALRALAAGQIDHRVVAAATNDLAACITSSKKSATAYAGRLRKRALFWRDAVDLQLRAREKIGELDGWQADYRTRDDLPKSATPTPTLGTLAEDFESFLSQWSAAGAPLTGSAQDSDDERARLDGARALRELKSARTLAQIVAQRPWQFARSKEWADVVRLSGLLAPQDPRLDNVREMLTDWLAKGTPLKKIDLPLDEKQAVTKDGELLIGTFKLVTSRATGEMEYRYSGPPGAGEIPYSKENLTTPRPLTQAVCLAQYNQAAIALNKSRMDKNSWHEFANECDRLQHEITAHNDKWKDKTLYVPTKGPAAAAIRMAAFSAEARFARDVSDHWNVLAPLLSALRKAD
jgi:hypothetical protein